MGPDVKPSLSDVDAKPKARIENRSWLAQEQLKQVI